jgi:hypothetical protein
MADAATPHASVFTDAGLPADFVAQLLAAASTVEASLGDRNESTNNRVKAGSGLSTTSRKGRHVVKVLNALVRLQVADGSDLLNAWVSAKRFYAVAGAGAVGAVAPSATPVAAPPVVATAAPKSDNAQGGGSSAVA